MNRYPEEEYLMISGIQHFAFCRRQWALIHIEYLWEENRLTSEGELLHKNAHNDHFTEKRPGILISRGMRVSSSKMGMTGQCDVVECTKADEGAILHGHRGTWQLCPVEYKHGKDKKDESDILQLCCEAMCLEEMTRCRIPYGYLYYNEIRRRRRVIFTEELRKHVNETTKEMHAYFYKGYTPKVKPGKHCNSCSMRELCIPKLCKNLSTSQYYKKMIEDTEHAPSA